MRIPLISSLLFLAFVFFLSCNKYSNEQKKSERLVKIYLDSLNKNVESYKVIKFGYVDPIYNSYNDDTNYQKDKYDKLKADSIRTHFKPQITGWVIYVKFEGKDYYDNLGTHYFQCGIDKQFKKCFAAIEVDRIY